MAVLVKRTWHGDEILARSRRACGRALIGMGETTAVEMQKVAHVESGDLRRSIHAAKEESLGEINASAATIRKSADVVGLEVGSWLPYACVENSHGGTHRFADIGWEHAHPTFDGKLVRAWREEGL